MPPPALTAIPTRASALLRRAISPFREFGLGAGALYVVDRLLQSISPDIGLFVYEFMAQPIVDRALLPRSLAGNLSYRSIVEGDAELDRMPVPPEVKAMRFRQKAECVGTFRKGEFIGYAWFCHGRYQEDEVRCDYFLPDAATVFDFDFYVLPEHRGGIAFLGLWNGVNAILAARGIRYTMSRLTRFNLSSRRAHAHLGWRRIGQAVFLKLGGLQVMLCTLAPYLYVSAGNGRRPSIHLDPAVLAAGSTQSAPKERPR